MTLDEALKYVDKRLKIIFYEKPKVHEKWYDDCTIYNIITATGEEEDGSDEIVIYFDDGYAGLNIRHIKGFEILD